MRDNKRGLTYLHHVLPWNTMPTYSSHLAVQLVDRCLELHDPQHFGWVTALNYNAIW
jgi:hypothetical protein